MCGTLLAVVPSMRTVQAETVPTLRRPLALVTDVSSQLELELAQQLVAVGYELIIVSEDAQTLLRVAAQLRRIGENPVIETIEADLAQPGSAKRIHELAGDVGHLDVLVNNAKGASDLTVIELSRLVADDMVERGRGKILFTSGHAGTPDQAGVSRGLLHAFAVELHDALENTGVTVTSMSPVDEAALPLAIVRRVAQAGYQALMRGEPTAQISMHG